MFVNMAWTVKRRQRVEPQVTCSVKRVEPRDACDPRESRDAAPSREKSCAASVLPMASRERPSLSSVLPRASVEGKVELRGRVGESIWPGAWLVTGILAGPGCIVMMPLSGRIGEPRARRVAFG